MIVERGLGYVPAEERKKEKLDVGLIAIDSIFTPIRKIDFDVEDMRVGDRTNFNKLKISIETDGSIDPEVAFLDAVDILVNQFSQIKRSDDKEEEGDSESSETEEKETEEDGKKEDAGKIKVSTLDLSTRTLTALENSSVKTVAGLIKNTESDILGFEGMGEKGVSEIKSAIADLGVSLKSE